MTLVVRNVPMCYTAFQKEESSSLHSFVMTGIALKYCNFQEYSHKNIVVDVFTLILTSFETKALFIYATILSKEQDTVDNKKTHPPCFSTFRFSCISPEPLEVQ